MENLSADTWFSQYFPQEMLTPSKTLQHANPVLWQLGLQCG